MIINNREVKSTTGEIMLMTNGHEVYIIGVIPHYMTLDGAKIGLSVEDSYYIDTIAETLCFKEFGAANNGDIAHTLEVLINERYIYSQPVELRAAGKNKYIVNGIGGVNQETLNVIGHYYPWDKKYYEV